MSNARPAHRRVIAAPVAALAAVLGTVILSPGPTLLRADAKQAKASTVSVTVESVSPSTPAITATARPLIITVSLRNNTSTALTGVELSAERGDPITTQAGLTASLADPDARHNGRPIAATKTTTVTVPASGTVVTTFRTSTSTVDRNNDGICLCIPAGVYPIDLAARGTVDGASEILGGVRTYLPSFDVAAKKKVAVAWVWPLIDRPHRSGDGTVFTDDDLTASVLGGRLDRALQVVEGVAPTVPVTLVVDPDLVDELQVMASRTYQIRGQDGTLTVGTGQQAAAGWLARLRVVLAQPNVNLDFTPPADPDMTGLTEHDMAWSTALPAVVASRVARALGTASAGATFAWPPTSSATKATLDRLTADGVDTVLLDGTQTRPATRSGIPVSVARLKTSTGRVAALLTDPTLQRAAGTALTGSTTSLATLTSELAVRVAQQPTVLQSAVIAAPRYVDPSPTAAINTIKAVSTSLFSQAVSTDTAVQALPPGTAVSTLRTPADSIDGLSSVQLDRIAATTASVEPVRSLISGTAAGRLVVASIPAAVQRAESAAWSRAGASIYGGPTLGAQRLTTVSDELSGYLNRVRILKPSSGSYTLASSHSPLPISIRNESTLAVRIRVSIRTVGGLPGFDAPTTQTVLVPAESKTTLKVPTRVQRSGRIPVEAQLMTPDRHDLGDPVKLFVHSTVLGTIGVVITIVAGAVLGLALLIRFARRVVRLRRKRGQNGPRTTASRPRTDHDHEPVL